MEGEKTAVVAEEEAVAEVVGGGEGSVGRCLAAETYFVEEAIFAAHHTYLYNVSASGQYRAG